MPCARRRRTGAAVSPRRGASRSSRDAGRRQSAQFAATVCRGAGHDRCDRLQASTDCRHREARCRIASSARRRASSRSSPSLSLADELPIPRFFEQEAGPYITAGAIVARDRVSGATNLSIARLMPLGGNRAFVGIAPNHHLAVLARAAHARGEKLDIAVTHRQSSGGAAGGLPLSRARRGRTADRRRAARRAAGSGSLHAVGSAGAGALRMRAGRHARCRRAVHRRAGQRVPRHV